MKDALIITTDIRFGWRNRLRLLVHGQASMWSCVETENVIGRSHTREVRVVVRPAIRWRQPSATDTEASPHSAEPNNG